LISIINHPFWGTSTTISRTPIKPLATGSITVVASAGLALHRLRQFLPANSTQVSQGLVFRFGSSNHLSFSSALLFGRLITRETPGTLSLLVWCGSVTIWLQQAEWTILAGLNA